MTWYVLDVWGQPQESSGMVNLGTLGLGKMENVDIYLAPAIIWLPPRMSPACFLPHLPLLGECGPGLRWGQDIIRCFTSESSYHKTLLLLGFTVCSQERASGFWVST